jgi:hypothetical protein
MQMRFAIAVLVIVAIAMMIEFRFRKAFSISDHFYDSMTLKSSDDIVAVVTRAIVETGYDTNIWKLSPATDSQPKPFNKKFN